MNKLSETKQPSFACDLSSLTKEEREQLFDNSKVIFSNAEEIRPLANGYALIFPKASDDMIHRLSNFIIYERLCCSFIRHALIVETGNSETCLELTGEQGVKEYITSELKTFFPNNDYATGK